MTAGRSRDDDPVGPELGGPARRSTHRKLGDSRRFRGHQRDVEDRSIRTERARHADDRVSFGSRTFTEHPLDCCVDSVGRNRRDPADFDGYHRFFTPRSGDFGDCFLAVGEEEVDIVERCLPGTDTDSDGAGGFDRSGERFVTDDADALSAHHSDDGRGNKKSPVGRSGSGDGFRSSPIHGTFLFFHRERRDMHSVLKARRPAIDAAIESLLPRAIDEEYLAEFFGDPTYEYDPGTIQRALADPIWDLLDRGGKRWRAVLFLLFVEAFGEDPEEYLEYAAIPEILHNGTIIVDDVEDGATHRRGAPALHHVYGTDVALNAGNAMYFFPLKIVTHDPGDLPAELRLAAYEMLMGELNRTHLGQGVDICWHNEEGIDTSEAEYLEMCACKTGCLGRIVARLAAIVTDTRTLEPAVAAYAEEMSIAFQIADDVLDVEHALEEGGDFGKGVGNDIREGKKTLMAIHAVENATPADAARLEELLWAEENTDAEVEEAIGILESTGSVEYARSVAAELSESSKSHLDGLELAPEPAAKLVAFAEFVVDRRV